MIYNFIFVKQPSHIIICRLWLNCLYLMTSIGRITGDIVMCTYFFTLRCQILARGLNLASSVRFRQHKIIF